MQNTDYLELQPEMFVNYLDSFKEKQEKLNINHLWSLEMKDDTILINKKATENMKQTQTSMFLSLFNQFVSFKFYLRNNF